MHFNSFFPPLPASPSLPRPLPNLPLAGRESIMEAGSSQSSTPQPPQPPPQLPCPPGPAPYACQPPPILEATWPSSLHWVLQCWGRENRCPLLPERPKPGPKQQRGGRQQDPSLTAPALNPSLPSRQKPQHPGFPRGPPPWY